MRCAVFLLAVLVSSPAAAVTPETLWEVWPEIRFVHTPAPCLRHAELVEHLDRFADTASGAVSLEAIGSSVEGRAIHLLTVGSGPTTILLWSQMHGDEPSATPALLDLASWLVERRDDPSVAALLDRFTLLMVPMLNPDGADAFRRRNAQGIDINRDARHLATPEGRLLKALRDRYRPLLGFNLHDQSPRTTVGDSGKPATIAVLAVSGDGAQTMTEGRERTRRACSAIVEAVRPFIGDHVARFNEDWNPRAFGDRITAWGTPVILIESGGLPRGADPSILVRLNFVAVATVLFELAENDLRDFGSEPFESLPRTRRRGLADVVVRGGTILPRGPGRPFRADVAFNLRGNARSRAGCAPDRPTGSSIVELGDAGHLGAGTDIDAKDALIVEPWTIGVLGWEAGTWLDGPQLNRLANLGVGRLVWSVPEPDSKAAEDRIDELRPLSPIEIEFHSGPIEEALPVLRGPVHAPDSRSVGDIAAVLTGRSEDRPPMTTEEFSAFFEATGPPPHASAQLAVGRPATFLILGPAPNGQIDPARTQLQSITINGSPISGGPAHVDRPLS